MSRKLKFPLDVVLNEDIRKYENRLIGVFTLRQVAFLAVALVVCSIAGGAAWFLTRSTSTLTLVCTVVAMPILYVGFASWHGLPREEHLKVLFRDVVKTARLLPYKPDEPEVLKISNSVTSRQVDGKLQEKKKRKGKRA